MIVANLEKEFEKSVKNKFNLYNSLFLNLPYSNIENIGILIPILHNACKNGLEAGLQPQEILDNFFKTQAVLNSDDEKIDFMFRVIQYVERQVVLYDSVEDAAYPALQKLSGDLSLKNLLTVIDGEKNTDEIVKKLTEFSARVVFTAHPTQFYPPQVLEIISRLRSLITENNIEQIDLALQQLGLTSLMNSEKPTPFEEAQTIIYFLRTVYYEAVSELYNYIKANITDKTFDNPDLIKLGFWPGGDRDGNPFVTAKTTIAVADELRMSLFKCYYRDIKSLEHKLTFRKVEESIKLWRDSIYTAMFDESEIIDYKVFLQDLSGIRDIIEKQYNSLYLDELNSFINKIKIFRTHFAALDIRQNHSVHKMVVENILYAKGLIKNSLDELSQADLIRILLHENMLLNPDDYEEALVKDTLLNIQQVKKIQAKNGEEGCNRYIISNSEDVFSVLFVYALFRWCGYSAQDMNIDIVPLFESMAGMENSEKIMQQLFDLSQYRSHVEKRRNRQTIMLGFSDGTKDGGYLQANWSIFRTKEKLTAVCERNDIKAIFFDGRGGPPARGGGKTHRFYAAQSSKIANHEIQLTIQGQTITSKYGTKRHFFHNCEQLLTAGLYNQFLNKQNEIAEKDRQIIEELGRISFEKYTALKNHPKFLSYLENRSTLKYYGEANIGSRPAKRGNKKKLELSDLRAISYVGSWSQLKQNVPGYFGIGTALKTYVDTGKLEDLKKLFHSVPFFKALILNSMMSLSKCYFELTTYLEKDPEYNAFWKILYDEYLLSKEMVLMISGYDFLMQEEPISRNSIAIREKIVLPLLVIQQYALQKIEHDDSRKNVYEKIVKRSLYGNINASRNSA
ncbi:MAG: phosphoenolpyruvate carboxylase [Calditrichaeota bacterium]|nr:phosphoenolpyruvate carboxylase [Calditrichota bacterium]